MAGATLSQVREFFGYPNLSAFRADWEKLSESERAAIREGIGNGSLTY